MYMRLPFGPARRLPQQRSVEALSSVQLHTPEDQMINETRINHELWFSWDFSVSAYCLLRSAYCSAYAPLSITAG